MDTLRGFALLGILLMNILGFGLPFAASFDPAVDGSTSGPNMWIWALNAVMTEGKMRALFSMLFGAGVIILTSRLEQRGLGLTTADVYYRRILWLMAFGIVHSYLFWWGDILFSYAVIGLALFPLRKLSARALIVAGLVLLLLLPVRSYFEALDKQELRAEAAAADALAAAGAALTDEQKAAQEAWKEEQQKMRPSADDVAKETEAYRGGFADAASQRLGVVLGELPFVLYHFFVFDIGGMMLLGMGLYKLQFFSATRTYKEYGTVALVGFGAGVPLAALAVRATIASGFDVVTMAFAGSVHSLARIVIAVGWAATIMMVCKAGILRFLTSRLAAVGQMAFTNYFMHTLVFTTLFYGYGFGLFGHVERYQLYYMVAAMWVFQLIVSKTWLQHFRFGPVEWLWRSLTYWKRQRMRFASAARAAAAGGD